MTGRGWTAALLLFAVLFMHGLQCDSVADSAAHPGADPMVSVAVTAGDAGHQADAVAAVDGRPAADLSSADLSSADHATAGALMTGNGGASHPEAAHLWAVCLAVLAAGLAILLSLLVARLAPLAHPAVTRALARAAGSLPRPRPPDLHALCLLRT
jgi:Family of unknown function (DUF6153)